MALLREISAWAIGLTVWGSCFVFMVHGLWTGAWYGYVFGTLLVALLSLMLVPMYLAGRVSDEELLKMLREMEREERSGWQDEAGPG